MYAIRKFNPQFAVRLQRCLAAFDQDSARVINAALEGSIPEHVLAPGEPQRLVYDASSRVFWLYDPS